MESGNARRAGLDLFSSCVFAGRSDVRELAPGETGRQPWS